MAGALETAHRLEILRRDVEPGNILITDFGIARIAGGFETTAGVVTGSPACSPPRLRTRSRPPGARHCRGRQRHHRMRDGRRPRKPSTATELGEQLRASQRLHRFPVDELALRTGPGAMRRRDQVRAADPQPSPEMAKGCGRSGGTPLFRAISRPRSSICWNPPPSRSRSVIASPRRIRFSSGAPRRRSTAISTSRWIFSPPPCHSTPNCVVAQSR